MEENENKISESIAEEDSDKETEQQDDNGTNFKAGSNR